MLHGYDITMSFFKYSYDNGFVVKGKKGWFKHPIEHGLAARGIRTSTHTKRASSKGKEWEEEKLSERVNTVRETISDMTHPELRLIEQDLNIPIWTGSIDDMGHAERVNRIMEHIDNNINDMYVESIYDMWA